MGVEFSRGKMPLANDRDPSGVKPRDLSLTTGPHIGKLFLARSLSSQIGQAGVVENLERLDQRGDGLSALGDVACGNGAEPARGSGEVERPGRGRCPSSCVQVASTAGRLVPMTSTPEVLGVPMIGPSPSMPMMPSTMARWGDGRRDIEDGLGNARVMQHVLGPAVTDSRASRRRGSSLTA